MIAAGRSLSVSQPSTLRMVICPEASKPQNSMAAVSADGSTVCVLMRRLNSSCSRSMALVVRTLFHCAIGSRVREKLVAGFFQAVRHGSTLEAPLANECLTPRRYFFCRLRVDHVREISGDLLG